MKSIMNKGLLFVLLVLISVPALFAKSYSEYLAEAKKYEEQKRWCYALGSYYDAMGTDERPENKQEAYEGYKKLKDAIVSGNPGLGKYNLFTIHDEWKNLLIDAEKYGSSISIYDITVGELEQGDLDYKTRTATYTAKIDYCLGDRFKKTVQIIEQGYKKAYKKDWTDLPEEWPLYSASSKKDKTYNVNGALVYARSTWRGKYYINAFYQFEGKEINGFLGIYNTAGLYDYKFNIVDKNGEELVKGKRWLLGDGDKVSISGITPDVMDLIDNGEAFINPVGCYLQYGEYNEADDKGGRTFMKNFPEVQLSMDKIVCICWNNKTNQIAKNFGSIAKYNAIKNLEMININDLQIHILQTEVTQALYVAVIGENPSYFEGEDLPVEQVSWYDAIYFCNKLSELKGFTSVYSVDGNSNTTDWNYTPHNGDSIKGTIEQNEFADGFRLPTEEEWVFAAKGGEQYNFAGSNNPDEVGWYGKLSDIDDVYIGNSGNKTHSVAQKKANAYGLYDMVGNVSEWCGDGYVICGSNWNTYVDLVGIDYREKPYSRNITDDRKGLRVVRSSPEQIAEKQRLAEELIRQEEIARQEEERRKQEEEKRRISNAKVMITNIINNKELVDLKELQIQIMKTEMTQDLYEVVMGENPSSYKGEKYPVESVSWYDAIYFCNRLSEIKGFTPVYFVNGSTNTADWNYTPHNGDSIKGTIEQNEFADGFRLPSEKEWEYAAKGGEDYKFSGSNDINEVGWYKENSEGKTHPVAQKKANGYGLYDMTGNVWEWCWDREVNWLGDTSVIRSGSWYSGSDTCRISYRYNNYGPNERYENLGFRIVRSVFK
ncbi:MAG: SUMF1/EgtB/PvdO family nonheme iron enzyme [Spirochaetaceae bacterium]|nr:SUMF1/EgtB/PvdO family nonheme iron enzyme [Spirochaetaceae bacterium]